TGRFPGTHGGPPGGGSRSATLSMRSRSWWPLSTHRRRWRSSGWGPSITCSSGRRPDQGALLAGGSLVLYRDSAARAKAAPPPLEPPGKAAEMDLAVEDLVYLAAKVLDVDHIVGEQQRVHDLVVRFRKDLVQRSPQFGLGILRLVWPQAPDHRVHRMIG